MSAACNAQLKALSDHDSGMSAAWEANAPRDLLKLNEPWRSDAIRAYLQGPIALRLRITKGESA